jgi:hypothetical protein
VFNKFYRQSKPQVTYVSCEVRTEFIFPLTPRVEAGWNTSTVTLRVLGGDERGSLRPEAVKYGNKSKGTRTQERLRWQGPAAYTKDRPVLSLERATYKSRIVIVKDK